VEGVGESGARGEQRACAQVGRPHRPVSRSRRATHNPRPHRIQRSGCPATIWGRWPWHSGGAVSGREAPKTRALVWQSTARPPREPRGALLRGRARARHTTPRHASPSPPVHGRTRPSSGEKARENTVEHEGRGGRTACGRPIAASLFLRSRTSPARPPGQAHPAPDRAANHARHPTGGGGMKEEGGARRGRGACLRTARRRAPPPAALSPLPVPPPRPAHRPPKHRKGRPWQTREHTPPPKKRKNSRRPMAAVFFFGTPQKKKER
jgi:hypothetical protein